MTNSISRAALVSSIESVRWSVASKDIVPSYMQIYIENERLFAFNGEVGIQSYCPGTEGLGMNVPGRMFIALVSSLSSDEVEIEAAGTEVIISAPGVNRTKLKQMPSCPPPYPKKYPTEKEWRPVPPGFVEGMKRCLSFTSKNDSRPHLSNVCIVGEFIYSTDSIIGARCRVDALDISEEPILVTNQAAEAITNLGQPERVCFDGKSMWLDYGDTVLFAVSPSNEAVWPYDGVDQLIDTAIDEDREFNPVSDELVAALRRLNALSQEKMPAVTAKIEDGVPVVVLVEGDASVKEYVSDLTIPATVFFKPFLLSSALEWCDQIAFPSNPHSPILAYGDIVECTVLLMPMASLGN